MREKLDLLIEDAREASKLIIRHIKDRDLICITSHIDADGISSAGIIGSALYHLDSPFIVRAIKQLDERALADLAEEEAQLYIFTDLGSGYLDLVNKYLPRSDTIILDHHPVVGKPFPKLIHVNPHLFGFNGAKDISGAGVVYLMAKEMSKENIDLAPLAIVGALGDVQDRNERRELRGLNKIIVEDAISAGYLEVERDLIFYGRETRPIHESISHTMEPFIPDLSGREDECYGFLVNIGLKLKEDNKWRTLSSLTKDEKKLLYSELSKYLILKGSHSMTALALIGTVYTLTCEAKGSSLRDAREFSLLLNACGRMGKSGLGISICMGDRGENLGQAEETLVDYRRALARTIDWLRTNPDRIQKMDGFYLVRGENFIDDRMIGAVSTILMTSGLVDRDKPVLALTLSEEGMIKVSARATEDVSIQRGLDLGSTLHIAAKEVSGTGGGHKVAAGAQIPREKEKEFLKLVNSLIRKA